MKKSEFVFNTVSLPLDSIALLLSALTAFYFRLNQYLISKPVIYEMNLQEFLFMAVKVMPVVLLIFAFLGLYSQKGTRTILSELGKIVVGISLGLLIVILLFFFDQTIFPSRFIILATWGLGFLYVALGRLLLKSLQRFLFKKGYGLHKVVVVKGQNNPSEILEKFLNQQNFGYKVVKNFSYSENLFDDLNRMHAQKEIDEIFQVDASLPEKANLALVEFARNKGLEFSFVPNLFEVQRSTIEIRSFQGLPIISLKNSPLDGWGRIAKRLFDIVTSLICLILTLPLFVIISIAIRLNSPGKAIYSAYRGGRGRDFKFYKFRSMYSHLSVGADYGGSEAEKVRQELWKKNDRGGSSGPFLKIKDDPRVTSIGKFLRKSKLDELPQFFNVLKGDMSMVGPRAHVLDEVERYRSSYNRMFSIKPGIFGLSQIAQFSWPDLPFEEEIRLNTFYIENWSLWLDVKILTKSFWLLFFAKKPKADY